ncbi:PhyR family response regulator anti-anti-sigma factor [Arenibaculum pallidiluteum]|uniref:PhyR family response regulator anti-anti-sigma factor n=1 Tax=Arenibaculum pallidiluteum TaxID=2812559 RepID=UPI001A96E730|nr:response regulator [Arenibaculum pallidiluteum]
MDALADNLMAHLPFLRRYGRALAGSTEEGDALVTRAVEEAFDAPEAYRLDQPVVPASRIPLYAAINRLFDERGGKPPASAVLHPIEQALRRLPEEYRRIFVLVSLEELSFSQVAEVMAIAPERVREAMAGAQAAVREQLVATILIVEDDAIIAFDLSETVISMGHRVAGTAATQDEALAVAAAQNPTLALMDLRLAHGDSGIATAQALRERSSLPIIFVTAFAEELRQRGLDHLGPVIKKPFTREQIERAITQAVFTPRTAEKPTTLAR